MDPTNEFWEPGTYGYELEKLSRLLGEIGERTRLELIPVLDEVLEAWDQVLRANLETRMMSFLPAAWAAFIAERWPTRWLPDIDFDRLDDHDC